ncbi:MAG TPA: class I SAM-dependent methyltransferase, partial [Acidimicrobiales bacterium]|nr:class I SAM-dependent methyltransferase [Acidimicrobiales bacterium]
MSANVDNNAAIWQTDAGVQGFISKQEAREAKRRAQWMLMGELLPFGDDEAFTVLDIGAGTGPAARAVLDLFPRANAILADFSSQMMDEGAKSMARYQDRYQYVTFDMNSGEWPDSIPSDLGA